jgi:hypothetical protein
MKLRKFIATTIREYLNESYYGSIKKWYRGVGTKYDLGSSPESWIWITDNVDHAKEYGDNVVQYDFDYGKYETKIAFYEIYDLLVEYAKLNNQNINDDIFDVKWNPTTQFIDFLKSKGYVGYHFEAEGGERLCIFNRELLKNPVKVTL